jgi:formylmethanofuran dehydrogenase subunit E
MTTDTANALPALDQATIDYATRFHGHQCGGLAIGIQAARLALREVGAPAPDEEIVAVVETDMCAVDAIQALTGCTFGKGNLIHRDWGKNAYTFFRRSDGKAVRIAPRAGWHRSPELEALMAKPRAELTPAEQARAAQLRKEWELELLATDPDELFSVTPVNEPMPHRARLHASVTCADCGEQAMEIRVRKLAGRDLCAPCFERALAAM